MPSSPTPIAIAVVEHRGHFLIGRRGPGRALEGLWEFPGGKVEPGETPAMAASRECREETGLSVTVQGEFPPLVHRYDHDRVQLHFFVCTPEDPDQPPRSPFCWVAREHLSRYDFPAGNRALLDHLTVQS